MLIIWAGMKSNLFSVYVFNIWGLRIPNSIGEFCLGFPDEVVIFQNWKDKYFHKFVYQIMTNYLKNLLFSIFTGDQNWTTTIMCVLKVFIIFK